MNFDVHFENGKVAKWEHIRTLHKVQSNSDLRCSSKLTDSHVNPNNRLKMSVAKTAQVLCKTVASSLRVVSLWHEGAGIPNCSDTADMVGQMDTIWDSVNGYVNGKKADPNKSYCFPLTSESPHLGQASATFELLSRHQLREPRQALLRLRGKEGKVKESRQNRNVAAVVAATLTSSEARLFMFQWVSRFVNDSKRILRLF